MQAPCAGATGGVSLQATATEQPVLSPRIWALIGYLLKLDPTARHTLVLNCRGSEPWEIEEHVAKRKIELKP